MRGKGSIENLNEWLVRITPAYAGKRPEDSQRSGSHWDHPRVCGEKYVCGSAGAIITGSPPRMRGKDNRTMFSGSTYGITPAYAGKRASDPGAASGSWDHPRVCGEKYLTTGKRVGGCRITPAYAGKSPGAQDRKDPPQDHPRVCGEKFVYTADALGGCGITPAYAGKSSG